MAAEIKSAAKFSIHIVNFILTSFFLETTLLYMEEIFMLNEDTIKRLIELYKNDEKYLGVIERCLESFEEYHN